MPCGINNYLIMPSMSEAMANAFEAPVFFYTKNEGSQSCFPHFCPPIFIGYIQGKWHFVELKMENPQLFPALSCSRTWEQSATNVARAWKKRYTACLEMLTRQ
jgi:hypothetical protein